MSNAECRDGLCALAWHGGVAAVFCAAILLAGCRDGGTTEAQPPRQVLTLTVRAASADNLGVFVGAIAARHVSDQGFRVPGTVLRRQVEVGQHVSAGQPLLQLDPSNFKLTLQQARAQLDAATSKAAQARVDLGRDAVLLKQNFISQAAYDRDKIALDTAVAELQAAQAQYDEAANQLDYATLRAAVDGLVTAIDVDVGQVVAAGRTAVSIARDGDREVVISIPETRLDQLRSAGRLTVSLWADPGKSWSARLREIDPAANSTTGTYDAHVTVLEPDASLRLGMTAYVHLEGPAAGPQYAVPLTAVVYPKPDAPAIWKVGADEGVETHPVVVASVRGDTAYIASGLTDGDVIVTKGGNLLHPGQKVVPVAGPGAGD